LYLYRTGKAVYRAGSLLRPRRLDQPEERMAPPLLQLKDIALTFGGTPLLSGAELSVSTGERVSLVGRNGSGKSTLLKIAAGNWSSLIAGSVFVQPGALVRYLSTGARFLKASRRLRWPTSKPDLRPNDDHYYAASHLLEAARSHRPGEIRRKLSGGEARRASLARVLAPSPDILLLDEPTNHLDLTTIEWLEHDLDARRTALVIISHDRRFLATLSRSTVWLDRGQHAAPRTRLCPFRGMARHAAGLKRSAISTSSTARSSPKSTGCATASPAGASATCAGSVMLHALAGSSAAPIAAAAPATPTITAGSAAPSGALVIEAARVSARVMAGVSIVSDFSTRIQRGDRIGIVGPNGSGKTTLINMLTGVLAAG
jgi:ATP-binding cassette subfamily F protein uup